MQGRQKTQEQQLTLDPQTLMEEARAITGLSSFGADFSPAPLIRYLEGVTREVRFKPGGLEVCRAAFIRHLVNRLRIEEDLRRHPEILQEDVSDPIVVIGLPRTGTTKLQRMLSAAPNVQRLYMWRMLNPAPFPNVIPGAPDPRIAAARMGEGIGSEALAENQTVKAGHEMAAMEVDEDFFLFDFTLDQSIVGAGAYAPYFSDDEWAEGRPEREADLRGYRYERTLLQYLQWQDGGKRGRPWVLKLVTHLAHLDALFACYPRATLIHTHRDPRIAVASISKVMYNLYGLSAEVDKKFMGEGMLRWCSNMINRSLDARDRLRLDDRIYDVRYEDVRTDTLSIVRELYRRNGRELTPEADQAMACWEKENEQGKHSYSLEEFGLSEAQVSRAFAKYAQRFSPLF